ncbi:MAG: DUF1638 domain-containing protein [Lentisphaerae bacterium]|nr:DUF1638 domain-containing protein [Lentisphaerota bacterium]
MKRDLLHIKAIVCNALRREFYHCAARSPNIVDITLLPQGLHDQPEILREKVRADLTAQPVREGTRKECCPIPVDADSPYDAIVLGYALCSNATAEIKAIDCPLIIPRAHDCISLLLGSHKRYLDYFNKHPGTYWYSSGWIETSAMPGKQRDNLKHKYFTEKYGADNAQFLIDSEKEWFANYNRAVYINWNFPNSESEKTFTRESAEYLNWEYDELTGDPNLIQRLLDGDWAEEDFLVLQPGETLKPDPVSEKIMCVCKHQNTDV